ncbi:putative cytochrome P450 [Decorospora gaudefroyi]|uniref:Putative cytochrome P450 n=1 Tax=Decorospora gaudefroyi TaxID=184978 RepID=A0A6A5JZG5_9PLEO|nr:putative cytochrome P450 [Decorospora gaudefroyi]
MTWQWLRLERLVFAYLIIRIVYNISFHPLARFPGPFWARATLLWRFYHTMSGRSHRAIQDQHKLHGPVFRVSPNELSFASASSWKAIYGFPPPGQAQLVKGEFYDIYGAGFKTGCIGSERNPAQHARKKKNLTAAFSVKALQQQEAIVQKVVDEFTRKLGHLSAESTGRGINIVNWMEMVTFDILGEMAFGESFHCVEKEKHHPWIDLILNHLLEITLVDNLRRFSALATLGKWLLPGLTVAVRNQHSNDARGKVKRRLQEDNTRQDFLTNLVSKVKSGSVPEEELAAHASTLIIAGGETTATCLAATTYYLLKTPLALRKLTHEIRTGYNQYTDIDATSAQQLPYLQAALHESLRIYPPGSLGFPRISPGCQIDGVWIPRGTEVYTSAFSVTHNEKYFRDAERFVPERWLDGDAGVEGEWKDVREASQPFSLGYRACIGRNFAFMQMASIMAKMLFLYDIELVNDDLDFEAASHCHVMWWKAPVWVRFLERARGCTV